MPLLTCKMCGKVFTSPGGRTCPACLKELDELYPKVREYLRDNPKTEFNVDTLSEAMGTDIRAVQALADMGYLDRDLGRRVDSGAESRQKLAKEFENSLKQMQQASARESGTTYGEQRYGDRYKRK